MLFRAQGCHRLGETGYFTSFYVMGYTGVMNELLNNIWLVYLESAPWLLLGLFFAGLVKVYIPESLMQRWLGGTGLAAVSKAALVGAPLPLCSCGVLPAALGLRRSGASREATVSFLISTPETSLDSVAVTYALMGPVMAIYRPVAALVTAISTGLAVSFIKDTHPVEVASESAGGCCESAAQASCCSTASGGCDSEVKPANNRLLQAIHFAGAELLDDIAVWMAVGIGVAGLIITVVPEGWLAQWGGGITAMLVMLLVGVPMYICAVASTPVAAGLLVAGVSPGAVLVFLLVGPATNFASLVLLRRELGLAVTSVYILGISLVSIIMGLLLDMLLASYGGSVKAEIQDEMTILPYGFSLICAILLLLLAIRPLRNRLLPFYKMAQSGA